MANTLLIPAFSNKYENIFLQAWKQVLKYPKAEYAKRGSTIIIKAVKEVRDRDILLAALFGIERFRDLIIQYQKEIQCTQSQKRKKEYRGYVNQAKLNLMNNIKNGFITYGLKEKAKTYFSFSDIDKSNMVTIIRNYNIPDCPKRKTFINNATKQQNQQKNALYKAFSYLYTNTYKEGKKGRYSLNYLDKKHIQIIESACSSDKETIKKFHNVHSKMLELDDRYKDGRVRLTDAFISTQVKEIRKQLYILEDLCN